MNSLTTESNNPYSPCDADPLFLPAREVYPLLPDFGLVSPGQDLQVLGQGARLQHLLVEAVLVALPKGDVVSETGFLLLEYFRVEKSLVDIIKPIVEKFTNNTNT